MADLKGKVAIVTGASSGIGEATAKQLAAAGAKVAVAARRKDRLEKLVGDIEKDGGTALAIETDVTDRQAGERLVKRLVDEWGQLDIIVNNAGVMLNGMVKDSPIEDWEQMVQLNLMGLIYLTRLALPELIKTKGHIVNVSSVAGRTARAGSAVYNATEWGVNAFTEALRQELVQDKTGVRTTLIEPGAVDTELQSHLRPEVHEGFKQTFSEVTLLTADDIAEAILFAVSRPAYVNVNEILIRPTGQER